MDGLPGYVLEPDDRGFRELNVNSFQNSRGSGPDIYATGGAAEVTPGLP